MRKVLFVAFILTRFWAFGQSEDSFAILQGKDGGITVTGYTGSQKEIVIPEKISGLPVTIIGKNAFSNKSLTKVSIPRTVTMVDERAFAGNAITEVTIANGVKVIWNEAFADNQIKSITLPNSITDVGGSAFRNNKITSVVWPASLDFVRIGVFQNNPVETVTFGGAKTISDRSFEGSDISSITIAKDVLINIESGLDRSFINFYNSNGKRAGTYIKNNRIWSAK